MAIKTVQKPRCSLNTWVRGFIAHRGGGAVVQSNIQKKKSKSVFASPPSLWWSSSSHQSHFCSIKKTMDDEDDLDDEMMKTIQTNKKAKTKQCRTSPTSIVPGTRIPHSLRGEPATPGSRARRPGRGGASCVGRSGGGAMPAGCAGRWCASAGVWGTDWWGRCCVGWGRHPRIWPPQSKRSFQFLIFRGIQFLISRNAIPNFEELNSWFPGTQFLISRNSIPNYEEWKKRRSTAAPAQLFVTTRLKKIASEWPLKVRLQVRKVVKPTARKTRDCTKQSRASDIFAKGKQTRWKPKQPSLRKLYVCLQNFKRQHSTPEPPCQTKPDQCQRQKEHQFHFKLVINFENHTVYTLFVRITWIENLPKWCTLKIMYSNVKYCASWSFNFGWMNNLPGGYVT